MENLRKKFASVLLNLAKKDNRVIVIVADISHGIFSDFRKIFPKRYFNIGICEPAIISMAAGLKKLGFIPFVHTIAPFLIERSYEQIKLDVNYQELDINLVSTGSSFDYSKLGCSHHSYSDISLMRQFKRSQIFLPSSELELEFSLLQNYNKKRVNYFRLTDNPHGIDIKKSDLKKNCIKIKNGSDLTIVAVSNCLKNVLNATDTFNNKHKFDIFYVNSVTNINKLMLIRSLRKTKRLLVVEELHYIGGVYDFLNSNLDGISLINKKHLAINDFIHGYGSYLDMQEKAGLDKRSILTSIKTLLKK